MKIGMNLLLWTTHVTEEHYPLLPKIKAAGYDGVEIPLFNLDPAAYKSLRKQLDHNELKCTAVTCVNEQANPISADPALRQAGLEHIKKAIDMLAILGGDTLCGPYHSPLAVFSGSGPTADEKKHGAEVLYQAAEHARKVNITLGIEYLNRFECYFLTTAKDTRAFVDQVNHPSFGMMYDTFHANIEEKALAPTIHSIADKMVHVHISENDRGTPGSGHVHWDETFKALKEVGYDRWLVIEAFSRALPDLAAATKVWRDLFPSMDEVYQKGITFIKEKWAAH